jgi:thiamine biosynthesis protein ThiS
MNTIFVNGQPRELEAACTVAELLHELGLNPKLLAVEVNQEVVPRAEQAAYVLQANDRVEIVTLVGGG